LGLNPVSAGGGLPGLFPAGISTVSRGGSNASPASPRRPRRTAIRPGGAPPRPASGPAPFRPPPARALCGFEEALQGGPLPGGKPSAPPPGPPFQPASSPSSPFFSLHRILGLLAPTRVTFSTTPASSSLLSFLVTSL